MHNQYVLTMLRLEWLTTEPRGSQGHYLWKIKRKYRSIFLIRLVEHIVGLVELNLLWLSVQPGLDHLMVNEYFGVLCKGIKAQLPVKVKSVFIASICFIYFNSMVNSELICF